MTGAEKGLIPAFTSCLAATGVGVWSAEELAALISAGCSICVLGVYWYYLRKRDKREEAQADEHEKGSA